MYVSLINGQSIENNNNNLKVSSSFNSKYFRNKYPVIIKKIIAIVSTSGLPR